MALRKAITNRYGLQAEYWKVLETNINWHERSSHVALAGYVDEQARLDNCQPIDARTFDWAGEDFPFSLDGNNVYEAYEMIVGLEGEFADAEDC